ncbi:diguanylate cyclase/phosphodiesterase with PAS/PAC sensor(s) [Acinetobacter calcoaceticus]|uniref:Diguanylate cyclase/phosphodiesterase with PAS/PAC sensor(S) n=1 Tax=Acinetobacter calcoaceticus TaxID=471 RepID=A0A4R1XUY6_ACICA|nr:diguanylate cyclase/phosphodiesterase with PAS/PAC sensor(s) [Acinetobacter calcoaceticus]
MMDVQEDALNHHVNATQIKRAARHMQIFLIWVLCACAYDIVVYHLSFNAFSVYLSSTVIAMMAVIVVGWVITQRMLSSQHMTALNLDLWCQALSLTIGIGLGLGSFVIYSFLPDENQNFGHLQLMTLSILPISIIYIIAFTYLSQRLRYFLLIFIPSSLPFFLAEFLFPNQIPRIYNVVINVWLMIIFMAAILSFRNHRRIINLDIEKNRLLQQHHLQSQHTDALQSKLKQQIQQSQSIQDQLQQQNELLEQKIKQRGFEINQINDRLEYHQANLSFAHETAGISSWLWNIEKRMVELSTIKHDLDFEYFNNQRPQIEFIIHPDDLNQYRQLLRRHLRGHSHRFEANYRVKKQGEWYWIQDIGKVVSRHPVTRKPLRMVGIFRDIQNEKRNQEQLKLAANVFDQVAEGVFVLDQHLCYVDVNPYYETLIGFSREQLMGKHLFDITMNDRTEVQQLHSLISQQLMLTGEFESEIQEEYITGKNLSLWMHINAITDDQNNIINYVGITTDLTDRKIQEQRLTYLENHDLNTDLPNRFYYHLKLHHYINSSSGLTHFAVIRLNIDRFRLFNEFLNNHAGDELLKLIAQRLRNCSPDAQLIAYLNNDDFAIIYNLSNRKVSIHQQAQIILNAFQQPFLIQDQEHLISISMGIVLYPEHGRQVDSLMSHVEMALLDAKRLGGNTIRMYNNETTPLLDDSIALKRDLQFAIKKQQLTVYYQPQMCSKTYAILGFEALVRWQHPQRGLISPEMFIPLAEESSLISEIGQFVIFQSCKQIQIWRELGFGQINVSVNIVAQQIHRGQLLIDLDTAMSMYQVTGPQIALELTESSLLDHTDHVIELLKQIKQRQISISLDDFGTGYSSLAYLSQYPIDTLKIDKLFVSKIGNVRDGAIVDAIIAMAKAMGMNVIAEGVETRAQLEYLIKHECNVLQGFYFSKPLTALESTDYLNQYRSALSSSDD